jgi:hypothetical protein
MKPRSLRKPPLPQCGSVECLQCRSLQAIGSIIMTNSGKSWSGRVVIIADRRPRRQ